MAGGTCMALTPLHGRGVCVAGGACMAHSPPPQVHPRDTAMTDRLGVKGSQGELNVACKYTILPNVTSVLKLEDKVNPSSEVLTKYT